MVAYHQYHLHNFNQIFPPTPYLWVSGGGSPEDGIPPKICPEDGIPNFWVEDRIRTYVCLKLRYIRIELVYIIILSLKSISEVEYVCDEIFMLSFCIESTLAEDLIQKLKHTSTR